MKHMALVLIAGCVLAACSGTRYPYVDRAGNPIIRVGLLENRSELFILVGESFSLYSPKGRFIRRIVKGHRWRATIKEAKPARLRFHLRYWMTSDHKLAFEKAHELSEKNLPADIIEQDLPSNRWKIPALMKKIYHVVLRQPFKTRQEAEAKKKELARKVHLEIMEIVDEPAGGLIEVAGLDTDQRFEIESGSQIVVDRFALKNIPVGEGFHWANVADQVYRGNLELLINTRGLLTAVNVLPIESYLQGVVPSEMRPDFPLEALKAQAIAARSQVLVKVGRQHLNQGYDVCATVHCQVYSGMMRESEQSTKAIKQTAGLVLFAGDRILDAVYSGVCGGHTENNENVWSGNQVPQLRGIFDGRGSPDLLKGLLQQETYFRKWVTGNPPVYCNTVDGDIPEALRYTQKYFRWHVQVERPRLEAFIRKATGEHFGVLQDLVVLERGVSGRIKKLQVVGSLKTFVIEKDLNIRKALSETTLYSSAVIIEKEMDANGLPVTFRFYGAGWGHGVGMCQTGAARMAYDGKKVEEILHHYYRGARIAPAY